jgi:hypothetical protein
LLVTDTDTVTGCPDDDAPRTVIVSVPEPGGTFSPLARLLPDAPG